MGHLLRRAGDPRDAVPPGQRGGADRQDRQHARRHPRAALLRRGPHRRPGARLPGHRRRTTWTTSAGAARSSGSRPASGTGPTYVSLDIDVLDPAFAPGTGTPEAGGLTSRELLNILRGVRRPQPRRRRHRRGGAGLRPRRDHRHRRLARGVRADQRHGAPEAGHPVCRARSPAARPSSTRWWPTGSGRVRHPRHAQPGALPVPADVRHPARRDPPRAGRRLRRRRVRPGQRPARACSSPPPGPGITNAITALATAYADSVPDAGDLARRPAGQGRRRRRLAARGQGPAGGARRGLRPQRPGRERGRHPRGRGRRLRAVRRPARPRPVHLEVPVDVLEGPWPRRPVRARADGRPGPAGARGGRRGRGRGRRRATRPLVIAGGGARGAAAEIRALADLGIPVLTTVNGKGVLDEAPPVRAGRLHAPAAAHDVVDAADVLLLVGTEVGDSDLWGGVVAPGSAGSRTVVRVDVDPAQMHKNVRADLPVVGDAAMVLARRARRRWREHGPVAFPHAGTGAARSAIAAEAARDAGPWAAIQRSLASALPDDTVVAGDSSQVTYYGTVHHWPFTPANRLLYPTGYATLGYGLPGGHRREGRPAGATRDRRCSVTAQRCSASRSWSPPRSSGWRCRSSWSTTAATARSGEQMVDAWHRAAGRRPAPAGPAGAGARGRRTRCGGRARGRARAARGRGARRGPADRHPPRRRLTTGGGRRDMTRTPDIVAELSAAAGERCGGLGPGHPADLRHGPGAVLPRRHPCCAGARRRSTAEVSAVLRWRPRWPGSRSCPGGADRAVAAAPTRSTGACC